MRSHVVIGVTLLSLVIGVFVVSSVTAGPLNPPPGPIEPTGPVLLNAQEITLPYTINEPGVYRLTSDLVGVPFSNGIVVDADDVTLDLNGYTLRGVANSIDGVRPGPAFGQTTRTLRNLRIVNGTIRDWGDNGVRGTVSGIPGTTRLEDVEIEDVHVLDCTDRGIEGSNGWAVVGCRIERCSFGVLLGDESLLRDSVVRNCATGGVFVRNHGVVSGNTIGAMSAGAGVLIQNNATDTVIDLNVIYDCADGGIELQGSSPGTRITRNRITDSTNIPIAGPITSAMAPQTTNAATASAWANIVDDLLE